MEMWALLLLALLVSSVCAKAPLTAPSKDANDDQYAFLTELYENTSGEMWANNTNWLVRNDNITLCDWYGITCAGKWVEKIELVKNGLGGPLPNNWERVPYIDALDFSGNKLLGTIPESIGNLSLNSLQLSGNSLTGTIPSSLGKSNIGLLYLDNNRFSGTLPSAIAMKKLYALTLDNNELTGTVPAQFGQLGSQLMLISAAFNSFEGTLPEGVCHANACNFLYNAHLGCPNQSACKKCGLPLCNCGLVCYTSGDCAGGSCSSCSANRYGVKTCGGFQQMRRIRASSLSLHAKVYSEGDVQNFLANSHLAVTFDGFNMEKGTCVVSLDKDMGASFSSGVNSEKKGLWKIYKETPEDDMWTLEVLHFTLHDYMFFFDLEEAALTWKGKVDVKNKRVIEGVVSGLKKRFLLFPYTATMATFEGKILLEGEDVPFVNLHPINLLEPPPEDFNGPQDMVKYPHIFAPDFVEWYYAVEDAVVRGDEPPPRPKQFFIPLPKEDSASSDEGSLKKSKKKGDGKKMGFEN